MGGSGWVYRVGCTPLVFHTNEQVTFVLVGRVGSVFGQLGDNCCCLINVLTLTVEYDIIFT